MSVATVGRLPRSLVDPRTSKVLPWWDTLSALALIFTCAVTPFEVAFLESAKSANEPLFIVNRVVDTIFACDILLQFNLMVEITSESMSHGNRWIVKPRSIAVHYLSGWFAIDLLSTASAAFDYFGIIAEVAPSGDHLNRLRIFRIVRTLRLIKLFRLLRASRVSRRWSTRHAINYSVLALVTALFKIVVLAHWVACAWGLQAYLQGQLARTWLGANNYCVIEGSNTTVAVIREALAINDDSQLTRVLSTYEHSYVCLEPIRLYAAALYYAVATITSIGYGECALSEWSVKAQGCTCTVAAA